LKKLIPLMIIMAIFLTLTSPVLAAASQVRVFVDGTEVQFPDQKPVINADNRTLVPIRFISEALGAEVEWIALTRTVKINYQGKTILLEIGLKQALVGTSVVTLDTKAELINNRTMVPLRFVSECLSAKVEWDSANRAVYISTANSDQALINSDLKVTTPVSNDNIYNVNLEVLVYYKDNTPVEPQLVDLQEILAKRFNGAEIPVMDYIRTKKGTDIRLSTKDFTINGKLVRVYDSIGAVTVTVWN